MRSFISFLSPSTFRKSRFTSADLGLVNIAALAAGTALSLRLRESDQQTWNKKDEDGPETDKRLRPESEATSRLTSLLLQTWEDKSESY